MSRALLLLSILLLFLAAFLIPTIPLAGSTEAREAHVASLMMHGDSWILPLRSGNAPSKPPLFHWISAVLSMVSGVSILSSSRFVSLGSALGILCLLACHKPRRNIGVLSALLCAGTPLFIRLMIDARVDMLFAFFCAVAWFASCHHTVRASVLFWTGISMAILTKGPLGFLLPVIICLTRWTALKEWRKIRFFLFTRQWWLVVLCVPIGWYLLAWGIGGSEFLWRVVFENVFRFTTPDPSRILGPEVYLKAYLVKFAPWSILAMPFLFRDILLILRRRRCTERQAIGLSYIVGILLFCSSSGKRASYLLPLIPIFVQYVAMSFVASNILRHRWVTGILPQLPLGVSIVGAILCLNVYAALLFGFSFVVYLDYFLMHWEVVLLVLAVCLTFSLYAFSRRNLQSALVAYCLILFAVYAIGLGVKGSLKGFSTIAKSIVERVGDERKLVFIKDRYEEYFDPLLFLVGGNPQQQAVTDALEAGQWYITNQSHFEKILPCELADEARYKSISPKSRARPTREIVLFRCKSVSTIG